MQFKLNSSGKDLSVFCNEDTGNTTIYLNGEAVVLNEHETMELFDKLDMAINEVYLRRRKRDKQPENDLFSGLFEAFHPATINRQLKAGV